jgi:hypothetical protein
MEQDKKRFEEWDEVDCNKCTHYWDNSCDGVQQESRRQCNSFLATRRVVIPARLNSLEKRFKWLRISCLLADLALLLHFISHFMEWYNG